MATQIILPKDAEGKEVPLDTETLYDEYGNQRNIVKFIYHHDCETGAKGWTVEYDNGVERFVSLMYLTQPYTDSWKQLEEDLNNGISGASPCCAYAGSKTYSCDKCCFESARYCTRRVFTDIRNRIRKLRGEG
jgi:hypothetical protein